MSINCNGVILALLIAFVSASNTLANTVEKKYPLKDITFGIVSLDICGGLRLRCQLQNNFNCKKYMHGNDGFGEERLRLEFNVTFIENMHIFIQLQDSHVWDLQFDTHDFYPPYSPYTNALDVRQAYFEYQAIAHTPLGVKLGRQTFMYGDNRILGPGEWGNVGRYFWDAAKLLYNTGTFKMDLLIARRVMSDPYGFDTHTSDLTIYGIYSTLNKFNPNTDFFYILKDNDKTNTIRSTLGTRMYGNYRLLFYAGTFAYQFGYENKKEVHAYGYNFIVGYRIQKLLKMKISVEYSYASGDDNPEDETHKTFDGAFGAIDKYYGRMAFFSWMNLKNYQINLDFKPAKNISSTIQYHWFQLAEDRDAWYYGNGKPQRTDLTGTSGSSLGSEILISIKYTLNKYFSMHTGYCHFFPGEFLKNTPGFKGESSLTFLQTECNY